MAKPVSVDASLTFSGVASLSSVTVQSLYGSQSLGGMQGVAIASDAARTQTVSFFNEAQTPEGPLLQINCDYAQGDTGGDMMFAIDAENLEGASVSLEGSAVRNPIHISKVEVSGNNFNTSVDKTVKADFTETLELKFWLGRASLETGAKLTLTAYEIVVDPGGGDRVIEVGGKRLILQGAVSANLS